MAAAGRSHVDLNVPTPSPQEGYHDFGKYSI